MQLSLILTISVFCIFSSVAGDFVWAGKSSLQEKIHRERSSLRKLKQDIQEAKRQQEITKKQHDSVLQSIESLDQKLHQKRKDYDAIRFEIRHLDQELEEIHQKVNQIEVSLRRREQAVKVRLRRLYMEGQSGWFQPLLAFDSYAQFQRRMTYLSSLTSWEKNLLTRYEDDMKEYQELKEQQVRTRSFLLQLKQQTVNSLELMKGLKGEKQIVLTGLKLQTRTHKQTLVTLERAEGRKEFLLNSLLQGGKISGPESKKRAIRILKKGALLWPADGRVVAPFGRQKHPTFNTYINKKGIEIEAREGSEIKAVFGGNVVFADW